MIQTICKKDSDSIFFVDTCLNLELSACACVWLALKASSTLEAFYKKLKKKLKNSNYMGFFENCPEVAYEEKTRKRRNFTVCA